MKDIDTRNLSSHPFRFGFGNLSVALPEADGERKRKYYIGANGVFFLEISDEARFEATLRSVKTSSENLRASVVAVIKAVGAETLCAYAEGSGFAADELERHEDEFRAALYDDLLKSTALSDMGLRVSTIDVEGICLRSASDPAPVVVPPKKRRVGKTAAVVSALLLSAVLIFIAAAFASGLIGRENPQTPDNPRVIDNPTTVDDHPAIDEPRLKAYIYGDVYHDCYIPDGWGFGCAGDFYIVLKYDGKPIEDMENVSIYFANRSAGVITVGEHGRIYFHGEKETSSDVTFSYKGSQSIHVWHSFEDIGIVYSERLELIMPGFTEPVYYGFGNIADFICILKYDGKPIKDMKNVTVKVKDSSAGRVEVGKEPGQLLFYNMRETETVVTISYKGETLGRVWCVYDPS